MGSASVPGRGGTMRSIALAAQDRRRGYRKCQEVPSSIRRGLRRSVPKDLRAVRTLCAQSS
jgi:hypothetical protein